MRSTKRKTWKDERCLDFYDDDDVPSRHRYPQRIAPHRASIEKWAHHDRRLFFAKVDGTIFRRWFAIQKICVSKSREKTFLVMKFQWRGANHFFHLRLWCHCANQNSKKQMTDDNAFPVQLYVLDYDFLTPWFFRGSKSTVVLWSERYTFVEHSIMANNKRCHVIFPLCKCRKSLSSYFWIVK